MKYIWIGILYVTGISAAPTHTLTTYSPEELLRVGTAFRSIGDYKKAIPFFRAAVNQRPLFQQAMLELGCAYLAIEQFKKGFDMLDRYAINALSLAKPWRGESLRGKTIAVYTPTWGDGDYIMFARYLYKLKALGAERIIFVVPAWLQHLFLTGLSIAGLIIDYFTDFFGHNSDYHTLRFPSVHTAYTADYEVAALSLPKLLKETMSSHQEPYIFPDPERNATWAAAVAHDTHIKVGLCWQGACRQDAQLQQRAIPLQELMPLLTNSEFSWYCLQVGKAGADCTLVPEAHRIKQFPLDAQEAYLDTLALINNLDLIITIDTSIAHLAAAAGKRVWVLLPHAAEWRYPGNHMGTVRTDTPWYPTMRLFRQPTSGDWASVVHQVHEALKEQIGG